MNKQDEKLLNKLSVTFNNLDQLKYAYNLGVISVYEDNLGIEKEVKCTIAV